MTRKYCIDVLRIISAMAVIIIHTVSAPVSNSVIAIDTALEANLELIHTLMNWSVPVFFMITGYCLCYNRNLSGNAGHLLFYAAKQKQYFHTHRVTVFL